MNNDGMFDATRRDPFRLGKKVAILQQLREQFQNVAEVLEKQYDRVRNLIVAYENMKGDKVEKLEQIESILIRDRKIRCISGIKNGLAYLHDELDLLESELLKNSSNQGAVFEYLREQTQKGRILVASIKQELIGMACQHRYMISENGVVSENEVNNPMKNQQGSQIYINERYDIDSIGEQKHTKRILNCSKIDTLRKLIESQQSSNLHIHMPISNFIKLDNIKSITSECFNSIQNLNELSYPDHESHSFYRVNRFTINSYDVNSSCDYLPNRPSLLPPLPFFTNKKDNNDFDKDIKRRNIQELIKQLRLSLKRKNSLKEKESLINAIQPIIEMEEENKSNFTKKVPETFRQILNIEGELIGGAGLASGYLSARTRSKFQQIKAKCFSKMSNFPQQKTQLIPISTKAISVQNNKTLQKAQKQNQQLCNQNTKVNNFTEVCRIKSKCSQINSFEENNRNQRQPIRLGNRSKTKNEKSGKIVKNNSKMKLVLNR